MNVMNKNSTLLLDCTLRDGGYYNKWDFDRSTVDRYLTAVKTSSVDVVELGFRSLPKNTFMGPYFYTTDEFIKKLGLPKGPIYGVMINGKDFIGYSGSSESPINKLFQIKEKSPITLVRIAINFNNVLESESIAKQLKELGYIVGLNMMQAHGKSEEEYIETAKRISSWGVVDVLYFADSLGNMTPTDVQKICQSLKKGWPGTLGIHTHNNKNLALINSMTAVENGVTWCDGTIAGMGRGAGNASTEGLLLEMLRLGYHKGNAKMMQPAVEDFTVLKNKYGWGSNLYYHYASNHGIHPTFVQSLLEDRRYDNQQVLGALEFLADRDSTAYSANGIREAIYGDQKDVAAAWDATGWLADKEVLIVGAGPSVDKYKEGILQYIEKTGPIVLFLNINRYLPASLARVTVVSHETRALFDSQQYHNLKHPIVLPEGRLGALIKGQLKGLEILDYGLTLEEGSFIIGPNGCRLQWPLAAAYALAMVTQAGASKISLVGFDGYSADDPRQEEMNDVFFKYSLLEKNISISALTPTTYRVSQNSIFSPINN
jgi:4-hydroxy 2-oxovalerate aldolase